MTVAERFTERRERLGLTPRQLADRLGVSERTVKRWEAGEFDCDPVWLDRLDMMLHEGDCEP